MRCLHAILKNKSTIQWKWQLLPVNNTNYETAAKIKRIFQSIVDIADERVSLHGFPNRKLCVISIEKAKRIAIKYQVARRYTFVFSSFDSGTRSRRPWGIVTRFLLPDQIEHFWLIVHWLTSIFANQSRFSSRISPCME